MNKKIITGIGLILLIAGTTLLTYKSLENLSQLDLNDPFEVNLDEDSE